MSYRIMKKLVYILFALCYLQLEVANAQVDKKAATILSGVSAKYKSYKSINVDLPVPEGPITAILEPKLISKLRFLIDGFFDSG